MGPGRRTTRGILDGPTMQTRFLSVLGTWVLGATLLWWPRLSGAWRRKLAVLSSTAGLLCLILAMNTEGFRESPTMAVFLVGAPYVTERASASASLPYYVLTAICLLLGVAGLGVGDELARGLSRRWLATAVGLSVGIIALRFLLEKTAAPSSITQAVGITSLAPVVGAYFAVCLRSEAKGLRSVLGALLVYAVSVRGALAAFMILATTRRLGSHYDISPMTIVRNPFTGVLYTFEPGSLAQIVNVVLIPQLLVWPLYTLLTGLLGAWLISNVWRGSPLPSVPPPVRVAPAEQD
jgi:hypothetical protein